MKLTVADWTDVIAVLAESYNIWSAGLNKSQYFFHTWQQINHPWSRKNLRFLVYRSNHQVVGSLKLYTLEMIYRNRRYKLAGIGAVYIMEAFRNEGFGTKLLQRAIKSIKSDGFDAIFLFSDIGSEFYERLGFQALGSSDFWIHLQDYPNIDSSSIANANPQDSPLKATQHSIVPLQLDFIDVLERQHNKWLANQQYGICRSSNYWNFKLSRENYLHQNSSLHWPQLKLLTTGIEEYNDGYAIFEQGDKVLRVLEVIGKPETRLMLWQDLLCLAKIRGCTRLRGWKATNPPKMENQTINQRDWGLPMILPLKDELKRIPELEPSSLVELDHI